MLSKACECLLSRRFQTWGRGLPNLTPNKIESHQKSNLKLLYPTLLTPKPVTLFSALAHCRWTCAWMARKFKIDDWLFLQFNQDIAQRHQTGVISLIVLQGDYSRKRKGWGPKIMIIYLLSTFNLFIFTALNHYIFQKTHTNLKPKRSSKTTGASSDSIWNSKPRPGLSWSSFGCQALGKCGQGNGGKREWFKKWFVTGMN